MKKFGLVNFSLRELLQSIRRLNLKETELMLQRDSIISTRNLIDGKREAIDELSSDYSDEVNTAELIKSNLQSIEQSIQDLFRQIEILKKEENDSTIELKKAKDSAARTKTKMADEEKNITSMITGLEDEKSQFVIAREVLLLETQAFKKHSEKDRKKRYAGPSDGPLKIKVNDIQPSTIYALGDIHGWAPGLMNYMMKHQLANFRIAGIGLHEDEEYRRSLFADPIKRTQQQLSLPRMGLDHHPMRGKIVHSYFHRIQTDEYLSSEILILMGDLVDRGDHNELVLECVRQSILQNMGARWTLLGNHEQMLIENDFRRWSKNEYNYMAEANKEHAGSFLHQPLLTGKESIEEGLKNNFSIIQAGLGTVLLAQHLALLESLNPTSKKAYIGLVKPTLERLKMDTDLLKKELQASKWSMMKLGLRFIEGLRDISQEMEVVVPGGIGIIYSNHHLFMHAEPNGLEYLTPEMWGDLSNLRTDKGLHFSLIRMNKEKISNASFLWERNWIKNTQNELRGLLSDDLRKSVHVIVHGHQAGPGIRETITDDKPQITVQAIDEGMTPYYFYNYGNYSEAYDPLRTPVGYKVDLI